MERSRTANPIALITLMHETQLYVVSKYAQVQVLEHTSHVGYHSRKKENIEN